MPNTVFPTNIGSIRSGANQDGTFVIGRNPNIPWEAAGLGVYGRPDGVQQVQMFLTSNSGAQLAFSTTPLVASVVIDATSMYNVLMTNPLAPQTGFFFAMREVSVCEVVGSSSIERKMMVLSSQTYPTGAGGS